MLVVGENTYITIAEIDTHMQYMNNSTWFDLSDSPTNPGLQSKSSYLYKAFVSMTNYMGETPQGNDSLKNAQKQVVAFIFENETEIEKRRMDAASNVRREEVGEWDVEYFPDSYYVDIPNGVKPLLNPYKKTAAPSSTFFVDPGEPF